MSRRKNGTGAFELYMPTPAEIEAGKQEVRKRWSEEDFQKRSGIYAPKHVEFDPLTLHVDRKPIRMPN